MAQTGQMAERLFLRYLKKQGIWKVEKKHLRLTVSVKDLPSPGVLYDLRTDKNGNIQLREIERFYQRFPA